MAKKYPTITITQAQHDYIKELSQNECIAVTIEKAFTFIFNKEITQTEHAYMSTEYNTIQYIVRAIMGNYNNRLNVVEVITE
jgi:hypothetical protein